MGEPRGNLGTQREGVLLLEAPGLPGTPRAVDILNGTIWLIISVFSLILIDMTDTWTRKAIKFMDKADKTIRKFIDSLFEWIQKKNLKILSSIILLIVFGILSQLGIIPKLIT